jgi:hypothetical protein
MAGDYTYESEGDTDGVAPSNRLTKLTNAAGAAVSLALVVGIGVWGYKLLVRDVSGIPVVRAVQGDMRVRPAEPGGELARHQGLSVNAVAAAGTAGKPADQLKLAPNAIELTDDDQPVNAAMVAAAPQMAQPAAPDAAPAAQEPAVQTPDAVPEPGSVDDIVAQLTAGVSPLKEVASAPIETETVVAIEDEEEGTLEVAEAEDEATPIPAAVRNAPGVRQSLRPRKRPTERAIVMPASLDTTAILAEVTKEIDSETLPAGTRLVQLGAFDSPEIARAQWDKLGGRFDAYMQGKTRIVQKATSGGRTFYRLRAHGFDDISDARRFCSALVAENADCIPVVTR